MIDCDLFFWNKEQGFDNIKNLSEVGNMKNICTNLGKFDPFV